MMSAERSAMHGESGYARIENDAYWTPTWCVDTLFEKVKFRGLLLEPATGIGRIADTARKYGYEVTESDIVDHCGGTRSTMQMCDFLQMNAASLSREVSIVTNPPYAIAEKFVQHALMLTLPFRGMVAMLLRNEWDCARTRRYLFERPEFAKKIILTKRPQWSETNIASPRHNFAWFIWDHCHLSPPTMEWGP